MTLVMEATLRRRAHRMPTAMLGTPSQSTTPTLHIPITRVHPLTAAAVTHNRGTRAGGTTLSLPPGTLMQ